MSSTDLEKKSSAKENAGLATGKAPVGDPFGLERIPWIGWSNVVRRVRETLELQQVEYGQVLGVSRAQIVRYESGSSRPPIAFWIAFTKMTAISLSWAFSGLGHPYEESLTATPEHLRCLERMKIVGDRDANLRELSDGFKRDLSELTAAGIKEVKRDRAARDAAELKASGDRAERAREDKRSKRR